MRKAATLLLVTIAIFSFASPAYAVVFSNDAVISSSELIENAKRHEGQRITFQGEAIGDIMERGKYGWVNIHDGDNAIGVWVPVAELRKITRTGDYRNIGDTVLINGIFNQACVKHNGELDIHAKSITIVKAGSEVNHPVSRMKASIVGALFLLTVVLFTVNRYQKSLFIIS